MKKKLILILIGGLFAFNSISVYATDNLNESKIKFNDMSSQLSEVNEEISSLNEEIYTLEDNISKYEDEINDYKNKIDIKEDNISKLKEEIEKNQDMLSSRIREIYKSGTTSSLDIIFYIINSKDFNDLVNRIEYANKIIKLDNKLITDNNNNLEKLDNEVSSLEKEKEKLDTLKNELNTNLLEVKEKKSTLDEKKEELSNEIKKLKDTIAENEENLVKHQIGIINSSSSSNEQLKEAISILNNLLPEISTQSVIDKTNSAINEANKKLAESKNSNAESYSSSLQSPPSEGGYKSVYTMEATAYSNDGYTATGLRTHRDPNGISTVAIDPTVIPYGSKLYIPNYGYAIAADCGGAIKGLKIDLYLNTVAECYAFGRRQVTVYLVAGPGEW